MMSPAITLRGIVAVPDTYGRLRFLLQERKDESKAVDASWVALVKAAPARAGYHLPYHLREPDAEGLRGEFWASAEGKKTKYSTVDRSAYWGAFAEARRGQEVEVEVAVQRYAFAPKGKEPIAGYKLTLVDIRDIKP